MSREVKRAKTNPEPARWTWKRSAILGLLGIVIIVSGVFAYITLFSQFRIYDDEGYFLMALRAYQADQGLYDRIDTSYGPFYFQAVAGLFSLLHVPLDNVSARWFGFVIWMVSGLAVYRFVRRVTASVLAGFLAYVLAFPILSAVANEPLHPSQLNVLLLSSLVLLSHGLESPVRRTALFVAGGALTAALALSKINVGTFAFLACAAFFLRTAPKNPAGKALRIGAAVLLPFFPLYLMAPLAAFRVFALFVSLALLPFGFLPWLASEERPSRYVLPYLLGGLALTTAVLALCFCTGTGPAALWHSLVTVNLHFPNAFNEPPYIGSSKTLIAWALIPLGLGALLRGTTWFGTVPRTLLKLSGGLVILGLCLNPPSTPVLALPLVWLVAVPGHSSRCGLKTRTFLALLVVLQSLHAYPVFGSQIGFFAFLLPAVGVLIVWDAFGDLPARWREVLSRLRWKVAGALTALLILATCFVMNPLLLRHWERFKNNVPLALPGAESIRLPEFHVALWQWVACNLAQNADTFVGLPGMHSFYGWSALPPPVPFYPHTWILFSGDAAQDKILQSLLASKRPCIVRNRRLANMWMLGRSPQGPLVRASEQAFRVASRVEDIELLFPLSVRPDLVLSGFFADLPQEVREHYGAAATLRLSFPALPGVHIARLTVHDRQSEVDVFDTAADSPARRPAILDLEGKELLRGNPPVLIDLSRRSDVLMLCPKIARDIPLQAVLIRAFDEHGRIVARLLMPETSSNP